MFVPKLFTTLKGYTRQAFVGDLTAGVIVGVVALPLAIAFAIASGVSPEKGLITAVVAGFLISLLGGSRVQIGGPTGAFVVIVYGVVQKFGIDGLVVTTLMAGVLLIIMGLARFGGVIKFIPAPVITGFTSGIAVIIFSSEIKDLLGLKMGAVPSEFLEKWQAFGSNISSATIESVLISALALFIIIYWPKVWPKLTRKIPSPFVALIVTTVLVQVLGLHLETIGSRYGQIPSSLPAPHLPFISLALIRQLMPSAITVAILAAVESLLSAVVADGMIGTKHRSNMELVAQGIANIASSLFGGIPATGAIARTATNVRSGGRTPVAGIVHALTLLVIMLLAGHWASMIPLATLAAILVVVAYHMSEWRSFAGMMKSPKSDVVVLVVTFLLTVVIDLTVAVEVGMGLALLLFMRRMALVSSVNLLSSEQQEDRDEEESDSPFRLHLDIPEEVQIFEIHGPLFFGAAEKFTETMRNIDTLPKVFIVRMRDVSAIDATGIKVLDDIRKRSKAQNIFFMISELHSQPYLALEHAGLLKALGEDGLATDLPQALERARLYLAGKIAAS
jgi:SulP family sulfate permease